MKKLALFIGNCQATHIMFCLKKSKKFSELYDTKVFANWQMIKNNFPIPIEEIRKASIFVYQPLKEVYGCYSTDPNVPGSIGSLISLECKTFSFPYIYNSALWPIYKRNTSSELIGKEVIDKLIDRGIPRSEILRKYDNNDIDWEYERRFKESCSTYRNKENFTNLKMVDFIENNISNLQLFLIAHHPTYILYLKYANQILSQLDCDLLDENNYSINPFNIEDSTYHLSSCQWPIHESVRKHYDLKFNGYNENSHEFFKKIVIQHLDSRGIKC